MSKASIRRSVVGSLVIVALAVIAWSAIAQPGPTPPDSVNGVSGTATDIATGNYHSCAIQAGTGEVVCWGSNDGVLIDNAGQATPPDAVNGVLGTAINVVANGWHSCAIQTGTGSVICWGWDG